MLDDGTNRYVWGPNGLAYTVRKATGVAYVYHADGQGSVRAITDGNNAAGTSAAVVQTYVFDEFGVPTVEKQTSAGVNPENDFGYTGELRDSQVGLINLRARMYDPALGRFPQKDGYLGFRDRSASLNRYSYVENNPLTHRDPSGHAIKPGTPLVGPVSKNLALQVQPMPWPAPTMAPLPATGKQQKQTNPPCVASDSLRQARFREGNLNLLIRGPEHDQGDKCHVNVQLVGYATDKNGVTWDYNINYHVYHENDSFCANLLLGDSVWVNSIPLYSLHYAMFKLTDIMLAHWASTTDRLGDLNALVIFLQTNLYDQLGQLGELPDH
ncbi:MAG: RHS repeat-associated core domain-containing protein [Chloroflexota bacterium]